MPRSSSTTSSFITADYSRQARSRPRPLHLSSSSPSSSSNNSMSSSSSSTSSSCSLSPRASSTLIRRVSSLEDGLQTFSLINNSNTNNNHSTNHMDMDQQDSKKTAYITNSAPTITTTTSSFWSWLSLPGVTTLSSSSSSSLDDNGDGLELRSSQSQQGRCFESRTSSSVMEDLETQKQQSNSNNKWRELLRQKSQPLNVHEYASNREMTKCQEQWNAVTMLPPTLYCIVYVMLGLWVTADQRAAARHEYAADPEEFVQEIMTFNDSWTAWLNALFGNEFGCWPQSSFLPSALPPLTVLAVVLGTAGHMPFSFLYHWTYAHALPAAERVHHWSRRLDQSMIHFAAAMFAYGSSGSAHYFFACCLFNLDCARRHFGPHVRPRANQVRIGIAILAYSLPLLRRGDVERFGFFWCLVGFSGWLFAQYPIGGWSHAAFHLVVGAITPFLLTIAAELPVAQPQIKLAAQCAVLMQAS